MTYRVSKLRWMPVDMILSFLAIRVFAFYMLGTLVWWQADIWLLALVFVPGSLYLHLYRLSLYEDRVVYRAFFRKKVFYMIDVDSVLYKKRKIDPDILCLHMKGGAKGVSFPLLFKADQALHAWVRRQGGARF